jgi:DNA replication protein DnaC
LHDEISLARADGRLPRLMATWARTDVLVIDDFLLRPLAPDQAADLLEVIEDRVGLRSTIVTSQLPVAMWHEALGEPTVADGILDRLLENVHRVELHGESLRRHPTGKDKASSGAKRSEPGAADEK